ncbi:hypothetical protein JOF29_002175 [Kribbella aluminosa]|uniref:Uncharacterized protein n=1 Tax=Kribbella aluminosa TaxID=416017 RepID=A0ABS4UHH1_9ACTN|nr:hypothetical protein [Kribbella aluminosa]MBP2351092.1 hypothetical protein [Kribbella aluminosa]
MVADAATSTPVAEDREWEKACRCTVAEEAAGLDVVRDVAQAAAGLRAAMSERPS